MNKLTDKVAVVTGASKGIGAAIARALAAEGASVVVNYASSKEGAEAVVDEITRAGGKAIAVGGDVATGAGAMGVIDAAIERYGRLDVLVNNSGVYEFAPIEDVSEEQFHRHFNVNVLCVLAKEFGARKIRVNSINPGVVETEGTVSAGIIGSDFEKSAVAQTPLGRTGQPGDIADIAVFLASNDSRWLNGERLIASGGIR